MKKRYLVFAYQHYTPGGGWEGFKKAFGGLKKAKKYIDAQDKNGLFDPDHWEIVDLETLAVVYEFND